MGVWSRFGRPVLHGSDASDGILGVVSATTVSDEDYEPMEAWVPRALGAEQAKAFEDMIADYPDDRRNFARLYPPGTFLKTSAGTEYVVGYGEEPGSLDVSPIDPAKDYEGALNMLRSVQVRVARGELH